MLAIEASTATVSAQSLKPQNNTDMLVGLPYGLSQMRDSGLLKLARLVNMTAIPVSACMWCYCSTFIMYSNTIILLSSILMFFPVRILLI